MIFNDYSLVCIAMHIILFFNLLTVFPLNSIIACYVCVQLIKELEQCKFDPRETVLKPTQNVTKCRLISNKTDYFAVLLYSI